MALDLTWKQMYENICKRKSIQVDVPQKPQKKAHNYLSLKKNVKNKQKICHRTIKKQLFLIGFIQ